MQPVKQALCACNVVCVTSGDHAHVLHVNPTLLDRLISLVKLVKWMMTE